VAAANVGKSEAAWNFDAGSTISKTGARRTKTSDNFEMKRWTLEVRLQKSEFFSAISRNAAGNAR
jgi:hypothetical protein